MKLGKDLAKKRLIVLCDGRSLDRSPNYTSRSDNFRHMG